VEIEPDPLEWVQEQDVAAVTAAAPIDPDIPAEAVLLAVGRDRVAGVVSGVGEAALAGGTGFTLPAGQAGGDTVHHRWNQRIPPRAKKGRCNQKPMPCRLNWIPSNSGWKLSKRALKMTNREGSTLVLLSSYLPSIIYPGRSSF
jgi:hypothetical protein